MNKDEALEMLEILCYTFMPEEEWSGVPIYEKTIKIIDSYKEELDQIVQEPDKYSDELTDVLISLKGWVVDAEKKH